MTHRKHSKYLSLLLSAVMVLTIIHKWWIPSVADDPEPITRDGITYEYDGEIGRNVFWINPDNADSVSGNDITVPGGCGLNIIDTDLAIDSIAVEDGGIVEISTDQASSATLTANISLAGGASLNIIGGGSLSGNITPAADAKMLLGSFANKPNSVTLYDADPSITEPLTGFTDETVFIYLEDEAKWAIFVDDPGPEPRGFYVELGDYADEYAVTAWSDSNCTQELSKDVGWQGTDPAAIGFLIDDQSWDPIGDPDQSIDPDPVTIKVTLSNTDKVFLAAGLGWNDAIDNYAIDITDQVVLEDAGKTLKYTFVNPSNQDNYPHDLHLAVGYADSGRKEIMSVVDDYLYGYNADSIDATKALLAEELYNRFIEVSMYESFGIGNANDLIGKIEAADTASTVNVTLNNGTSETREVRNYTINWGVDQEDGSDVISTIPVYTLTDDYEYLVCTDFNSDNGTGSTFYSRIAHQDDIAFSNEAGNEEMSCVIYSDISDYSHVKAGGNGSEMNVRNSDGLCAFEIVVMYLDLGANNWGSVCRIMQSSETYVVIHSEGETLRHDGLGLNALSEDYVWRTGEGAEARVYIGDTAVYIEPLANSVTGVDVREIQSVTLADPTLADGVTIGGVIDGKVKVTFASNFYDTVPVTIKYTNGYKENLTIVRVGLVIQFIYLYDQGDGVHTGEIRYDCKPGQECQFTYNYNAGEQILVYATYYHPSNDHTTASGSDVFLNLRFTDGSSRIVSSSDDARGFNGHLAATASAVETTSFIIGFAPSKVNDNGVWTDNIVEQYYSEGAFNATVLNAGYNDATTYGGTQAGSGEGVYWDGLIKWFH